MKNIVFLLIAVLLGLGLGIATGTLRLASAPSEGLPGDASSPGSSGPRSSGPAPQVVIDRLQYDFGTLDIHGSGRHEFTLTNRGNALLRITKGSTTCRCTVSDLERTELPPGESTKIVLTWRPTADPGPYEQTASFYTNDPARRQFTVTISGRITTTICARPAELTLSRISTNETAQGSVSVLSYLDDSLKILDHQFAEKATAKYFDLAITPLSSEAIKETPGAKSGYFLTVTVKPGLPQGPFQQRIVLKTSNKVKPQLEIPILGNMCKDITLVGPDWDSNHETLYLGTVKSREGLTHRLLLIARGPYRKEVKFTLAETPTAPLKISLGKTTEINNGQITQTPLTIEIPKGSSQVSHLGRTLEGTKNAPDPEIGIISIVTSHPEMPKIRIPVRFAVEQ